MRAWRTGDDMTDTTAYHGAPGTGDATDVRALADEFER